MINANPTKYECLKKKYKDHVNKINKVNSHTFFYIMIHK